MEKRTQNRMMICMCEDAMRKPITLNANLKKIAIIIQLSGQGLGSRNEKLLLAHGCCLIFSWRAYKEMIPPKSTMVSKCVY